MNNGSCDDSRKLSVNHQSQNKKTYMYQSEANSRLASYPSFSHLLTQPTRKNLLRNFRVRHRLELFRCIFTHTVEAVLDSVVDSGTSVD